MVSVFGTGTELPATNVFNRIMRRRDAAKLQALRIGKAVPFISGRRGCLRAAAVLTLLLLIQALSAAQVKPTRRILILNEVGTSYPGINLFDEGIRAALDHSPYRIEVYREYLETILFPDPADQQRFRNFYIQKYQNRRPDVIITVGPSPLKFLQETHERAFPGVPIIFCMPNRLPGDAPLDAHLTGVEYDMAPAETLEAALRLQPSTERVVVVGGTSAFDRQQLRMVKERLKIYEDRINISYLTDLSMPALLERLKHLPSNTIVILSSVSQDAAGAKFNTGNESGPMVAAAANAPVFSLYDVSLNHGEVGGKLSNFVESGKIVGGMAIRMLAGEQPKDVPRVTGVNTYMFDWRALQRWGLKETDLPPGSIILNRQPTVWESYKAYIIGGVSLILAEALLIFGLLWQRTRARKAETELKRSQQYNTELVLRSPVAMVVTRGPGRKVELVNHKFTELFGYTIEDVPDEDHWWPLAYPDKAYREVIKAEWQARVARALASQADIEPMEASIRCKDGSCRHIEFHFASFGDSNLVTFVDVTERKLAEEAMADIGRKLIEAHEEERTWIGRELHDDINQRLALAVIELDRWGQEHSTPEGDIHTHLAHIQQRLSDLGKDVQALSHRLHSSKLDYLGLTVAASSFCRELSEQQKVEIDFTHEGMPSSVPKEISLCLFRVLQETLQNAVKHSGVRHFTVELRGRAKEIQLTVSDLGVGFDPRDAINRRGLGLISMRERLQLVRGEISIQSNLGGGTTIYARVPFSSSSDSARAVG